MMKKIELEILMLTPSVSQSTSYAVILGEKNGKRRLPVVIGTVEAQALAMSLEKMTPPRPLTHDLFKNVLNTFDIQLESVIISNLSDGIFFAQLICLQNGVNFEIDSRTSDALALAVRCGSPIYTYDFIMDSASVELADSGKTTDEAISAEEDKEADKLIQQAGKGGNDYSTYSVDELKDMIDASLAKEDYERAARIRDELKNRK